MEKRPSFILIAIGYLLAYTLGLIGYVLLDGGIIPKLALFDLIATVIIYVFSVFSKNTSFYDPYWSLTPLVMVAILMVLEDDLFHLSSIIFLIVIAIYSIRLTLNWSLRFKGLKEEDFRYADLRKRYKKTFELINFFGLELFPTVLVFMGMLPGFVFINSKSEWNNLFLIGFLVMLIGILLEFFSDLSLSKWRKAKENEGKTLNTGLFKYSRHPNYLGEMLVFSGIMILGLIVYPQLWWLMIIGSIAIDLLFIFVSVPMMDKRNLSHRADYLEYMKRTSMLLILPTRKIK